MIYDIKARRMLKLHGHITSTLRPRAPASKRDARTLGLSALSGTRPPQKPGEKPKRDLRKRCFFINQQRFDSKERLPTST